MKKINYHYDGKATAILILARTGSRFEDPRVKGISHFLEHMMFKGTKIKTSKEINYDLEKYGGIANAFTDNEITVYYVKVANAYREEVLGTLRDMVTNSIFPEEEVEKEREVIIQELKGNEDDPTRDVYTKLSKILYDKDSGLYETIIGTKETLYNINREELVKYYNDTYKDLIEIQVGDCFSTENAHKPIARTEAELVTLPSQRKHIFTKKDISQSSVVISNIVVLSGLPYLERRFAFDILSSIYSDMSGRLFNKIREEHNLVYRIHFYNEFFKDGLQQWYVTLGLDANKIDKAHELIVKELMREATQAEIDYATTKLIGNMELILNNPVSVTRVIAYAKAIGYSYLEVMNNYKEHILNASKKIREYQEEINFKENVLVGIVPE